MLNVVNSVKCLHLMNEEMLFVCAGGWLWQLEMSSKGLTILITQDLRIPCVAMCGSFYDNTETH